MKSLKATLVVSILTVFSCVGLHAQTTVLYATIPFDFHAGDRLIPAGEYQIHEEGSMVSLRSEANGKPMCALVTYGAQDKHTSRGARLEFERFGNEYFLTTVWNSYDGEGRGLLKTSRQKELAKQNNGPVPPIVVLATK